MPLLAPLLSLALPEDRYPPLTFSPQRQRQKTFEVLLAMLLEEGIATFQATGARLLMPWFLGLRAEAYGKIGQLEAGLTVVADALLSAKETGEHFYDAELQRLKGEFLLQLPSDNQREAEACFQQAMTIAQDQGKKPWNCAPPRAWRVCGSTRGKDKRRVTSWRRSTTGSRKALTRQTSRRRRCS
jgi:hypothetical protein